MSRRRAQQVTIKWEAREDEEGRKYAILRWWEEVEGKQKRQNKPIGYVTEDEADQARKVREAELLLGVSRPSSSGIVTVDDVLAAYLTDLERRPVSPGYQKGETQRCKVLGDHLGRLAADALTPDTLSRYLGDRRRTANRYQNTPKRSSLLMEVETLRRALRQAIEARMILGPVAPRPRGKIADDRRPARRLTEAEVGKLVQAGHREDGSVDLYEQIEAATRTGSLRQAALAAGVPYGTAHRWISGHPPKPSGIGWLLQVLAWSGRRPIAVLGLHVEDLERLTAPGLDRKDRLVFWRVDKGGVSRGWGPITEPARAALVARAAEVGEGRLWSDLHRSSDIWRVLDRVATAAEVDQVQPYDLRRFAVTAIMKQVGNQPRVAMRYTGHTQVATLLRYLFDEVDAAESLAESIGWSKPELVPAEKAEEAEEG